MLPGRVERSVGRYLRLLDRLLPGRVAGLYVVGSVALGAYRPNRSDVDLVVVVDGDLTPAEIRRVRMVHVASGVRSGVLSRPHLPIVGTCNAVYVRAEDLTLPVTTIEPLLHHCGSAFTVGKAFDVNPVVWQTFGRSGIAVRGPAADNLGLHPQPELLRDWNLANLANYWRPWGERILAAGRRPVVGATLPRWPTSWGVLGAPRLHHTIATGDVISKEAAGEYALEVFDDEWHPIVREGLAYWRSEPPRPEFTDRRSRIRRAAEFVVEVARDAQTRGTAAAYSGS